MLASIVVIAAAFLMLIPFMSSTVTGQEDLTIPLPPGGHEARYVPGHSQGDILEVRYRTEGGGGEGVTVYVGDRRAFDDLMDAVDNGTEGGGLDDAENRMLYRGDGGGDDVQLRLTDSRYLIGAHNDGPRNSTIEIELTVRTPPQYIMVCFSVPLVLVGAAAGWAATRQGGPGRGRNAPPSEWVPKYGYYYRYGYDERYRGYYERGGYYDERYWGPSGDDPRAPPPGGPPAGEGQSSAERDRRRPAEPDKK